MKKTNGFMKILLIIPVFLFVLLIGWIVLTEGNKNHNEMVVAKESKTSVLTLEITQTKKETQEEIQQSSEVHLLFAGDILLSSHVISAYDKSGSINGILDETYQSEIGQADIFMANEEFPFSNGGTQAKDKQFTFRVDPNRVSIMKEIGVDMVTLANNHTLDYGVDALVDACTTLESAGIKYVGAGANLDRAKQLETLEINGKTIGFLAASRVYPKSSWVAGVNKPGMVSGYDPTILLEEIKKAQDMCDYLVVYLHWGVEREEMPKEYQRVLGKKIIDAGADIVIGSHPHVLQGVEYYKGKPICYSMGNFLFGSSIPKTALLRVDVDCDNKVANLSIVPGTSRAGYTKALTDEEEIQKFYQYYQGISFGITVDQDGKINPNSE